MTNTRLGAPAVPWPGTCLGARRRETMREGPEMTNTQDSRSKDDNPGARSGAGSSPQGAGRAPTYRGKEPTRLPPEPERAEPELRPSTEASVPLPTGARTNPQKLGRCKQCCEPKATAVTKRQGQAREPEKGAEEREGREAGKERSGGSRPATRHAPARQAKGRQEERGTRTEENKTEKKEKRQKSRNEKEAGPHQTAPSEYAATARQGEECSSEGGSAFGLQIVLQPHKQLMH